MKVISKQDAMTKGLKRYFTGEPCRNGHIADRFVSGGCVECDRVYRQRPHTKEKQRQLSSRWYRRNTERTRENNKRWVKANPEAGLVFSARERAKVTIDSGHVRAMRAEQNDCCACCGAQFLWERGGHNFDTHCPTLDRLDPSGVYDEQNTRLICYTCNVIKNDATWQELLAVADFYSGDVITKVEANARKYPLTKLTYKEGNGSKRDRRTEVLWNVRARVKGSDITFALSDNDLFWSSRCPVLGIEFAYRGTARRVFGRVSFDTPSVDRIDPTRGYVPGNAVLVSNRANTIKSNVSPDRIRVVADWVRREVGGRARLDSNQRPRD